MSDRLERMKTLPAYWYNTSVEFRNADKLLYHDENSHHLSQPRDYVAATSLELIGKAVLVKLHQELPSKYQKGHVLKKVFEGAGIELGKDSQYTLKYYTFCLQ